MDVVLIYLGSSAVFPSKRLRPAPQASMALNFYFSRPSLFSNGQGMEWDLSEGYSPSRDHLSGFSLLIPFLFPILFFSINSGEAILPIFSQHCCCSVTKSCLTLCDPMNCRMPGFPVLHYLLEFIQIHVH